VASTDDSTAFTRYCGSRNFAPGTFVFGVAGKTSQGLIVPAFATTDEALVRAASAAAGLRQPRGRPPEAQVGHRRRE
jgi:hypothetical protein